jgi:hypothetical protein
MEREKYIKKLNLEIKKLLEYESRLIRFLSLNESSSEAKIIVTTIINMSGLILKLKIIKNRISKE